MVIPSLVAEVEVTFRGHRLPQSQQQVVISLLHVEIVVIVWMVVNFQFHEHH